MSSRNSVVYISGKISGTNDYKARFAHAEKQIQDAYSFKRIVNPVTLCEQYAKNTPWEAYMRICIKALMDCDAIYLMRGWRNSPGARLEQQIAMALDMDIIMQEKEYV